MVNRFGVMIDFVRDPNKLQILRMKVSCSAFDGGIILLLKRSKAGEVQKILQTATKDQCFD